MRLRVYPPDPLFRRGSGMLANRTGALYTFRSPTCSTWWGGSRYYDGTFQECAITTPTTTGTSTITVTTTPTTSPRRARVECQQFGSTLGYLSVPSSEVCETQTAMVANIAAHCLPDDGEIKLACVDVSDEYNTFVSQPEAACAETAAALNAAVDAYSRGTVAAEFKCAFGGYIYEDRACADSPAFDLLASAIDSYLDTTFHECTLSTPTTSPTTTETSSPTTSPTSTATTTLTSSPTSSPTSTRTTTATSTPMTTVTSTATTSKTFTPTTTTSASSTPTTSASSSQTTTATSTRFNGRFVTVSVSNSVYLGVGSAAVCERQVALLHRLVRQCNATYFGGAANAVGGSLFTCNAPASDGSTHGLYLIGTQEECTLLNTIAAEYSRNELELGELFEWSLSNNIKSTENGVAVLNAALESYDRNDEFEACVRTTPTTTATTTATSTLTTSRTTTPTSTTSTTPTSTPTTTALYGKAACHAADGIAYLTFEGLDEQNCASFVGVVNSIFAACTESGSVGDDPTVKCRASDSTDVSFALVQDQQKCSDTGAALSTLVAEYTRGTAAADPGCAVGGFVTFASADACSAVVAVVNDAFASFVDGTFETCHLSTPTTSPTTTATSSSTTTSVTSTTVSFTTTSQTSSTVSTTTTTVTSTTDTSTTVTTTTATDTSTTNTETSTTASTTTGTDTSTTNTETSTTVSTTTGTDTSRHRHRCTKVQRTSQAYD